MHPYLERDMNNNGVDQPLYAKSELQKVLDEAFVTLMFNRPYYRPMRREYYPIPNYKGLDSIQYKGPEMKIEPLHTKATDIDLDKWSECMSKMMCASFQLTPDQLMGNIKSLPWYKKLWNKIKKIWNATNSDIEEIWL